MLSSVIFESSAVASELPVPVHVASEVAFNVNSALAPVIFDIVAFDMSTLLYFELIFIVSTANLALFALPYTNRCAFVTPLLVCMPLLLSLKVTVPLYSPFWVTPIDVIIKSEPL